MMTKEQARAVIEANIKYELRHPYYKRTCDVAKFARQILTGDGQNDLVTQFKGRETDEQKAQRVAITKSLTKFATSKVIGYFKKVRRTEGVRMVIDGDEASTKKVAERLSGFNVSGLDGWLFEKLEYYYFNDPNAWILFERDNIVDGAGAVKDVEVYAVEVPSDCVIDFSYRRGRLQYLMFEQPRIKRVKDSSGVFKDVKLCDYYLYSVGFAVKYAEIASLSDAPEGSEVLSLIPFDDAARTARMFIVTMPDNGSIETPAIRCGAIPDTETRNATFVTPLEPAKELLEDLIQSKSEFDLTKALHTFQQKIAYAPPCDFEDTNGNACNGGYLNGNSGHTCPSCKGSGVSYHTTSQDVILLKMPDTKDEFLPLSDLVHYVQPAQYVPEFQMTVIDTLISRIHAAVFDNATSTQAQNKGNNAQAATATEITIEWDKIYDVLTPYASLYSHVWELACRVHAQYLSIDGVKPLHRFPKDFKLRSLDELIAQYEAAKTSGLSYDVTAAIEADIIQKLYVNDPARIQAVKARSAWKPFSDKSAEEIVVILGSRATDDPDRVLYENYHSVFMQIEREHPNFVNYAADKQRELVYKTAETVGKAVKYIEVQQVTF